MKKVFQFLKSMTFGVILLGIIVILSLIGMVAVRQVFLAWATARWPLEIRIIYYSFPIGWGATMLLLLIYTFLILKRMWREAEENSGKLRDYLRR